MSDLLADGIDWHREQLEAHASQTVVYRRGEFQSSVPVTFGSRNSAAEFSANTIRVEMQQRDFIIPVDELVIDGTAVTPCAGDEIDVTDGDDTLTYRVLGQTDSPSWEYDNDYRKLYIVHTLLVCEAEEL